jgi:hypothetical protein
MSRGFLLGISISLRLAHKQLNASRFTATFAVAGGGACRFIRLLNMGRNQYGDDQSCISGWEIFGVLIEYKPS